MSSQSNKTVVNAFNTAFDCADWDAIRQIVSSDVAAYATGAPGKMNFDAFSAMGQGFLDGFTQRRHVVEEQVAEGDVVATRGTWSAIHAGSFNGIPPTNRPIKLDMMVFDRIRDGKIVEHYGALDIMSPMAQLGTIPQAA